ncbi:MAG: response regulator transcription factor [Eubacteriales bacterium]|nr:response regulator transcription factor [Eubacteriales bacterium]MDD4323768.1 response regulator transcription factor [Eubacteriales bacterium]MDD4540732.1 response regulator transcription factor [Eubacteriales bacterium]
MDIVIVDDDPIVTKSLASIIELSSRKDNGEVVNVLATGSDGQEAIELYRRHHPDIILLDIRMEGLDGLTAGKVILTEDSSAKILYLTTFVDEEYIVESLRMGAKGYLRKSDVENILPALYAIHRGQHVYGGDIADKITPIVLQKPSNKTASKQSDSEANIFSELSEREWELVELIAQGLNNREISDHLHLSEGTVRNYLSTILEKLNLRDRTQLAVAYYKICKPE